MAIEPPEPVPAGLRGIRSRRRPVLEGARNAASLLDRRGAYRPRGLGGACQTESRAIVWPDWRMLGGSAVTSSITFSRHASVIEPNYRNTRGLSMISHACSDHRVRTASWPARPEPASRPSPPQAGSPHSWPVTSHMQRAAGRCSHLPCPAQQNLSYLKARQKAFS
jgi:hypothetical protein